MFYIHPFIENLWFCPAPPEAEAGNDEKGQLVLFQSYKNVFHFVTAGQLISHTESDNQI